MNPMETNQAPKKSAPADTQLLQSSLLMMAQGDHASNGPPGLSTTPTLSGLLQSLKRRWTFALGLALLGSALVVLGVFVFMPAKYQANIRLRVAKQAGSEEVSFAIFTANMEELVKSQFVLSAALNDKTAFIAPRYLNAPTFWRFSHLKKTDPPQRSSNVREVRTGV